MTKHRLTGRFEAHFWDASHRRETRGKGGRTRGRQVYLGGYTTEEDAARAYDLAALAFLGPSAPTNRPVAEYAQALQSMQGLTSDEVVGLLRRGSVGFARGASRYRGVTKHHQHGKWEARIGRVEGSKYLYLGTYESAEEAARAYDLAAVKFRGRKAITNFKLAEYAHALANPDAIDLATLLNNGNANANGSGSGLNVAAALSAGGVFGSLPAGGAMAGMAGPGGMGQGASHGASHAPQRAGRLPEMGHEAGGAGHGAFGAPLRPEGERTPAASSYAMPPTGLDAAARMDMDMGMNMAMTMNMPMNLPMNMNMAMPMHVAGVPPPPAHPAHQHPSALAIAMGNPSSGPGGPSSIPSHAVHVSNPSARCGASGSNPSGASTSSALPTGIEACLLAPSGGAGGAGGGAGGGLPTHLGGGGSGFAGLPFGGGGQPSGPHASEAALRAVLEPYAQQDPYGAFAFAAQGAQAVAPATGQNAPGAAAAYLWAAAAAGGLADPAAAAAAAEAGGYGALRFADIYGGNGDAAAAASAAAVHVAQDHASAAAADRHGTALGPQQGEEAYAPPTSRRQQQQPLPPPLSPSRPAASSGSHSGNGSLPGGFGAAAGAAAAASALDPLAVTSAHHAPGAGAGAGAGASAVSPRDASPRFAPSPPGSRFGAPASAFGGSRAPSRGDEGGDQRGLIAAAWAANASQRGGASQGGDPHALTRAPSRSAGSGAGAGTGGAGAASSSSSSSHSPGDRHAPATALREAFFRRLSPLKTHDLGALAAAGRRGARDEGAAGVGNGNGNGNGGQWGASQPSACLSPLAAALLSPLGGGSATRQGGKAAGWIADGRLASDSGSGPGQNAASPSSALSPRPGSDERHALATALSANLAALAEDSAALSQALANAAANGQAGPPQGTAAASEHAGPPHALVAAGAGALPLPQGTAVAAPPASPPQGALSTPRATRPGVLAFGGAGAGAGTLSATPGTIDNDLWSAFKWLEATDAGDARSGGGGAAGGGRPQSGGGAALAGIRVTPMELRGGPVGRDGAEEASFGNRIA